MRPGGFLNGGKSRHCVVVEKGDSSLNIKGKFDILGCDLFSCRKLAEKIDTVFTVVC